MLHLKSARRALAFLASAALCAPAFADAFSFTATDTPQANAETVPVTSTIVIASNGAITDLNVNVSYTSSFDGDATIVLTHVNTGTSITLVSATGGNGDNFTNTTFDDEAATAITAGLAPFTGSFSPQQLLSAFDGQDIFGTWTLTATDGVNDGTGHSITSFTLSGTVATPEPGTFALFGLGVAGLGGVVLRRRRNRLPTKSA